MFSQPQESSYDWTPSLLGAATLTLWVFNIKLAANYLVKHPGFKTKYHANNIYVSMHTFYMNMHFHIYLRQKDQTLINTIVLMMIHSINKLIDS